MNLSASMIKDIITCSMKGKFRLDRVDTEKSDDLLVGEIVHSVLSTDWDKDYDTIVTRANSQIYDFGCMNADKVKTCIDNYNEHFRAFCNTDDLVEYEFKIQHKTGLNLVGRIDRMNVKNGVLLDWKTSVKLPKFLGNDIQLIMYDYVFEKLFGKPATYIFIPSLYTGESIRYQRVAKYYDSFIYEVIPAVSEIIKRKMFYREGFFDGYKCPVCPYETICRGK